MIRTSIALVLLSLSSLHAAVIYQFSVTGVNRATGFANSSGAVTDGMRWGLLFDTTGNGFSGFTGSGNATASGSNGVYDAFVTTASGFLNANSSATDDYYWVPTNPAASIVTSTLTAAGSDPGGSGGILTAQGSPVGTDTLPSGLNAGDKFAIIWFESGNAAGGGGAAGNRYGIFTDASFVLPASGAGPFPFNSPFTGSVADATKAANLTIAGAPEPSRALLLGFGAVGLMFRRRRA